MTIRDFFDNTVARYPQRPVQVFFRGGKWTTRTYDDLRARVMRASEAIRRLDEYQKALPELHRDIRHLLELANAIAMDSKKIWDPVCSLRGHLEAARNLLEQTETDENTND